MAVPAGAIWEARNGGSDTANGGGFDPTNTNFASDGAVTSADTASPVFSSASYTFVAGDVDAWLFIKSGTNSIPMWARIASVNAGAATLDCAVGLCPLFNGTSVGNLNTSVGCGTASSLSSITFGVDYSQQASPRTSITAATAAGAGSTITDTSIGKNWVGNAIRMTGGTNVTTGTFFVTSTSSTTATLDRAVTTGATSNAAGGMGGALASPGAAFVNIVAGNVVWLRGTADPESVPFTISSSSSNVAGGRLTMSVQAALRGYLTVRGDVTEGGLSPVLKAGVNSITLFTSSSNSFVQDIVIDGDKASRSATVGTGGGSSGLFVNVNFRNCTGNGFGSSNSTLIGCRATNNGGIGFSTFRQLTRCTADSNTSHGATPGNTSTIEDSLIHSNGGDGVNATGTCVAIRRSNISNNTGDGLETTVIGHVEDTIFSGNGNYGIRNTSATSIVTTRNVAYRSNSSGATLGNISEANPITLSGDPFTNGASDDYTIDTASAGGIQLKGAGISTNADGTSLGGPDVGQYQQPRVAGGAASLIGSGLIR